MTREMARVVLNNSASPGGGSDTPSPPRTPPPLLSDWTTLSLGLRPIKNFFWRLRPPPPKDNSGDGTVCVLHGCASTAHMLTHPKGDTTAQHSTALKGVCTAARGRGRTPDTHLNLCDPPPPVHGMTTRPREPKRRTVLSVNPI